MTELPEGHKVEFEHNRSISFVRGGMRFEPRGGATIARILDDNGKLVAEGTAVCSPKDNYNKSIGRQISLGRALKNL